jgi:EmrB/QacA subfamily drug resistance transporter
LHPSAETDGEPIVANIVMQPCDEGVVQANRSAAPCAESARPYVLAVTILGSSMVFIDGTVVNVALPALQTDMNASVVDVQWVVESYALLLAALLLVGGALGDKLGRKRVFSAGVTVFALASVWCGLAPSVEQLIVARAAQGVGGALLVPGSLAIIGASFGPQERGRAIGTWAGYTAITTALGPVLGGWLIEQTSWRAVFLLNVPLALVVLALAWWKVPESRDDEADVGLDWRGAVLATVGLGGTVYGLLEIPRLGIGDPRVLGALVLGVAASIAFVLLEARVRNPMVPLTLFRARDFTGANLLTLLLYTALSGALFLLPLNLIQVQGYSATAAGAATLPFVLIMFFLSRWSGGLVARYGARLPLIVGPAIAALGFALFIPPSVGGSYWATFFPAVVVLGLGMAVSVAPLTTTVMNAVGERRAGTASGINNAVARTAGVLAIAALGLVLQHGFNRTLDARVSDLNLTPQARQSLDEQRTKLAGADFGGELAPAMRAELRQAIGESFVSGFRRVMVIAALLALLSALSAWALIQRQAAGADHQL